MTTATAPTSLIGADPLAERTRGYVRAHLPKTGEIWKIRGYIDFTPTTPFSIRRHNVEEYERLKQAIHDVEEDIRKAEGGNKAAGTRVRKAMQEVKNIAQEIRKRVLEFRTD